MSKKILSHEDEHQLEHQSSLALIEDGNLMPGLFAGGATALAFGLGGYLLLHDPTGAIGGVLLLMLPIATGFATALVARRKNILLASLLLGLLLSVVVLLVMGKEGFVCVLMAAPLIAVGLAIGAVSGWLLRKLVNKSQHPSVLTLLLILITPLFLVGANSAEEPSRRSPRTETIVSTLQLDASPEKAWQEIIRLDSLTPAKPLLMKIGLPVPESCSLATEAVGGIRTCYFDSGYIEERITEWDPPHSMKLEITASTLPGTPWLGFKDASYEIRRENGHTLLIRSSTIISRLSPAWYWRRLERLGVETEHRYLFEEFKKRIDGTR